MIHGPGIKGNLNLLYSLVSKGLPWPLGALEYQRSFCSIDNLCFVIKELLSQEEIPSVVYNIVDDTSKLCATFINALTSLGKQCPPYP